MYKTPCGDINSVFDSDREADAQAMLSRDLNQKCIKNVQGQVRTFHEAGLSR